MERTCTFRWRTRTSAGMKTVEEKQMPVVEEAAEVRATVLKAQTSNPALQRLQGRVLAGTQASEAITSYDRMHHRHSRS